MDFDEPLDIFTSVSVIITPHEKGFTCGIIDPKGPADRDVCSYIAKGIVRFVTTNADLYTKKACKDSMMMMLNITKKKTVKTTLLICLILKKET